MLAASWKTVVAMAVLAGVGVRAQGPAQTPVAGDPEATAADKYLYLEDANSDRAMGWVKAENAKTAAVLRADPRFAAFTEADLKVISDPSRLPVPSLIGGGVENFWRDAQHMRGVLRRTTVQDYGTADPHWQTMLDIDALNRAENAKWTYKGTDRLYPGDRYALVHLSDGGEDAVSVREYDVKAAKFVDGGFALPKSKQTIDWVDENTLLVARDWGTENGAPTMTQSGYPFVIKQWKRGTPLSSATEVFRGKPSDVRVDAQVFHDAQGHRLITVTEGVSFFESKTFLLTPGGLKPVSIPLKSGFDDMLDGQVLLRVRVDWTPEGSTQKYVQGTLMSLRLEDLLKDPVHLKPTVVFAPTATEFLQGVASTRNKLVLTALNNVRGRAYVLTHSARGWSREALSTPGNVSVDLVAASQTDDNYALAINGFLTPPSLWFGSAADPASLKSIKSQPALFDASNLTVDQLFATSTDGTKVPYFVVHRKDMKYDGSNATLLNAYGGFENSETPRYSAGQGKLWLERGGVFVLANIRGGGEFGPAWHDAGLKTQRQHIYDDFAAVGMDLVARKITSPAHLGILGGSNGGLLMGVEMEQHPTLWNAVVIQVPLLDMLRFEQIAAGASWVGEYGSVTVPEQRAFLAGISPYNQLKPGVTYPEPLIFTTTKDDRVGPQHARKFAAKMEEFHEPFFYDEITEGGHGAGADLRQEAGTTAETYVYLSRKLMD